MSDMGKAVGKMVSTSTTKRAATNGNKNTSATASRKGDSMAGEARSMMKQSLRGPMGK